MAAVYKKMMSNSNYPPKTVYKRMNEPNPFRKTTFVFLNSSPRSTILSEKPLTNPDKPGTSQ